MSLPGSAVVPVPLHICHITMPVYNAVYICFFIQCSVSEGKLADVFCLPYSKDYLMYTIEKPNVWVELKAQHL